MVLPLLVEFHQGSFYGFVALVTFEYIDPIRELDLEHTIDIDRESTSPGTLY
jgi:hypothetical protein